MFVYLFVVCVITNCLLASPPIFLKTPKGDFAYPDDLNIKDDDQMKAENLRMHYHPPEFFMHFGDNEKFEHNVDFHKAHGIPLPGPEYSTEENFKKIPAKNNNNNNTPTNSSIQEIPLELVQKLNNYSVNDLLIKFVEDDTETAPAFIQDRFGGDSIIEEERSAATIPKEAKCLPELQTVQIAPEDHTSNILYIPQCTRIERCGGCCMHRLLSCQPTETETVSFRVVKIEYKGGSKLKAVQKEIVQVEKHTKCSCDCKIKAKDCKPGQTYNKSQCGCVCLNADEEKKCQKSFATKLWDSDSCTCQCRQTMECSTGSYFDLNECKCMPKVIKLQRADSDFEEF